MKFIGCAKAGPLAMTPVGSNPGAHALVIKTPTNPSDPSDPPENDIMSLKNLQRVASMNDVTKSYFVGLDETKGTAFLEKSAEDQDKEAAAAAEVAKKAKDEAAAKEAGVSTEVLKAQNEAAEARKEVADLKKALADKETTNEVEKTALSDDFKGFPGGKDALVPALKTAFGLDEAARKPMLDALKAQAAFARSTTAIVGKTAEEIAKSAPATVEVRKAADERAKANNTTVDQEIFKMSKEPAWRPSIEKMHEETAAAAQ
jgi:hypothetical protein